jgi:hypothetical protein
MFIHSETSEYDSRLAWKSGQLHFEAKIMNTQLSEETAPYWDSSDRVERTLEEWDGVIEKLCFNMWGNIALLSLV